RVRLRGAAEPVVGLAEEPVQLRVVCRGATLQAGGGFLRLSLLQLLAPVTLDFRHVERGVGAGDLHPDRLREASEVGAVEIPRDGECRLSTKSGLERLPRVLAAAADVEGPRRPQVQIGLLFGREPRSLSGTRVLVARLGEEARIEGAL